MKLQRASMASKKKKLRAKKTKNKQRPSKRNRTFRIPLPPPPPEPKWVSDLTVELHKGLLPVSMRDVLGHLKRDMDYFIFIGKTRRGESYVAVSERSIATNLWNLERFRINALMGEIKEEVQVIEDIRLMGAEGK